MLKQLGMIGIAVLLSIAAYAYLFQPIVSPETQVFEGGGLSTKSVEQALDRSDKKIRQRDADTLDGEDWSSVSSITVTELNTTRMSIDALFSKVHINEYSVDLNVLGDANISGDINVGGDANFQNISVSKGIYLKRLNVSSDANFAGALGISGNIYGSASKLKGIESIEGDGCTASGQYSIALGIGSTASGVLSTAIGNTVTASGEASFAVGDSSTASGDWSTALGYDTTASGNYSAALNDYTFSIGDATTSMGNWTTAGGWYSLATGYYSQSANYGSFAGGYGAVNKGPFALGQGSLAFGNSDVNMVAKGKGSIALGYNNQALGEATIALGKNIVCERANQTCVYDLNATGDVNFKGIETRSILSDSGYLLLGGSEQANNNNLLLDFTDPSGRIFFTSPSGSTLLDFANINLATGGTLTDGINSLTIANAKTAYDYSQIGHLKLVGGIITGDVNIQGDLNATGDVNFAKIRVKGNAYIDNNVITTTVKPVGKEDIFNIHPDANNAGYTKTTMFVNSGPGERPKFTIYGYSDALSTQKNAAIGIDSSGRLDFGGTATATVFSTDMAVGDEKKLYWGGTVSGFLSQNKQSGSSNRHTTFGGSNDNYDEPVWVMTDYSRILANLGVYDVANPQLWLHDGSATATNRLVLYHNGTDANITSITGKTFLGNDVNIIGNLGVSGYSFATGHLDGTLGWEGTSQEALTQLIAITSKDGKIDHSTLPEFAKAQVPEYVRTYVGEECTEVIDQEACAIIKSSVPEACNENPEAKECQVECTETRTVCQDKFENVLVGYKDARDLGALITMQTEAIKALEARIKALEASIIKT